MTSLRRFSLADRYTATSGRYLMTGVQALVRVPMDQARLDRAAGLRIGTVLSGYPGSPLAGYDLELARAADVLGKLDVHHVPGVNEELAAAVVWGPQILDRFPHERYDGAVGIWYGKSPGVDRAGDALRHGNYTGGGEHCAALVVAGDDPAAKSSTLPNGSEWSFAAYGMPVLAPATVGEMLRFGLLGIAMSRLCGLWVALKVTTSLCDGFADVDVSLAAPVVPKRPFRKPQVSQFLGPAVLELERSLVEDRLPLVHEFARANAVDEVDGHGSGDRIGLVAAGRTYTDLRQALEGVGLDDGGRAAAGLRLLKLGLAYPVDPETVRAFAAGLETVIVVEEKRGFVEDQVRNALYDVDRRPAVLGKLDGSGRRLFPAYGELTSDDVAAGLAKVLPQVGVEVKQRRRRRAPAALPLLPPRPPNYCAGCPHSRSTIESSGDVVAGGIGCHGMAQLMTQPERQVSFITNMGSEGAPWLGAAPFADVERIVQNVGDGTFFHSGSQAIRQAVAAGATMTYKLLYNGHIAMTGGQAAAGAMSVPTLARLLEAEGVRRIAIVTEDPSRYRRRARLPRTARVYPRERYDAAMADLRGAGGVTVLVFDEECAAERRRARKRGRAPLPTKRLVINERVCEGCGDCGAKSNCVALEPVDTAFGRKTRLNQDTCNTDYACLAGDCPSFVSVYLPEPQTPDRSARPLAIDAGAIQEPPAVTLDRPFVVYLPGVGGNGVVTTNQVLAAAALMDGRHVLGLDQTGLAQKGGAVVSSLVLADEPIHARGNRVAAGEVDLLLALDPLTAAAADHLARCTAGRTVAIGDEHRQPTAQEVRDPLAPGPADADLRLRIDAATATERNLWLDATGLADRHFGDRTKANPILLGAAVQAGALPLTPAAMEAAYALNDVDVEANVTAFRLGRLLVADPDAAARATGADEGADAPDAVQLDTVLERRLDPLPDDVRAVVQPLVAELVRYQDRRYAQRYLERVGHAFEREQQVLQGDAGALTTTFARSLFKLMAYKDEYEVARLLRDRQWRDELRRAFPGATVKYNLHPPALRSRGLGRKLELGPWAAPLLGLLARSRRLRGTAMDPFGRAPVRVAERELVTWYDDVADRVFAALTADNADQAVGILAAPERIRGYEQLKLDRIESTKSDVAQQLAELSDAPVAAGRG